MGGVWGVPSLLRGPTGAVDLLTRTVGVVWALRLSVGLPGDSVCSAPGLCPLPCALLPLASPLSRPHLSLLGWAVTCTAPGRGFTSAHGAPETLQAGVAAGFLAVTLSPVLLGCLGVLSLFPHPALGWTNAPFSCDPSIALAVGLTSLAGIRLHLQEQQGHT